MNISLYSIFVILSFVILTIYLQSTSTLGTGLSACTYMGINGRICEDSPVDIECLPDECSTLLYEGVAVNVNNEIEMTNTWNVKDDIFKLNNTGKPVFLYLAATCSAQWTEIMKTPIESATKHMDSLKVLLGDTSFIAGLIFVEFELDDGATTYFDTENLMIYITTIKKIQNIQIGINLRGDFLQKYYSANNTALKWLDFCKLGDLADFYVFDVEVLNTECKDEFKETGVSPLDGDAPFTIIKAYEAFKNTGIKKEKLFFNFAAYGYIAYDYLCYTNYRQICLYPQYSKDICADTRASYFAKGTFVRDNGAGFIFAFADLDDSEIVCLCERNFPGFRAVLDGVNGCNPTPACPLFDRTYN